jgi:hypothetical protein
VGIGRNTGRKRGPTISGKKQSEEVTMLDHIKRACKAIAKWINLVDFFLRISSLENNIENAMRKCEMLEEDITDKTLINEIDAILYRLEYAHLRVMDMRKRGTDLIMYEKGRL